jgi:hypothetical protein
MFLHAHSVSFSWPQGGEFSVNTPLPEDLATVLEALAAQPRPKGRASQGARRAYAAGG